MPSLPKRWRENPTCWWSHRRRDSRPSIDRLESRWWRWKRL